MIRNIIWDVDGTLFDTYPAITRAYIAALAEKNLPGDPEQVRELAQVSLGLCGKTLAQQYGLDADQLIERFAEHYSRTPEEEQPPFPGAEALCAYIHAAGGVNLIATHRGRASLEKLLRFYRLERWFAGSLTADENYPRKPHPGMFNALIEQDQLRRQETLALGDRELDIQAGAAAGVRTAYYGIWPVGEGQPDWSGVDYAGLLRWLEQA